MGEMEAHPAFRNKAAESRLGLSTGDSLRRRIRQN